MPGRWKRIGRSVERLSHIGILLSVDSSFLPFSRQTPFATDSCLGLIGEIKTPSKQDNSRNSFVQRQHLPPQQLFPATIRRYQAASRSTHEHTPHSLPSSIINPRYSPTSRTPCHPPGSSQTTTPTPYYFLHGWTSPSSTTPQQQAQIFNQRAQQQVATRSVTLPLPDVVPQSPPGRTTPPKIFSFEDFIEDDDDGGAWSPSNQLHAGNQWPSKRPSPLSTPCPVDVSSPQNLPQTGFTSICLPSLKITNPYLPPDICEMLSVQGSSLTSDTPQNSRQLSGSRQTVSQGDWIPYSNAPTSDLAIRSPSSSPMTPKPHQSSSNLLYHKPLSQEKESNNDLPPILGGVLQNLHLCSICNRRLSSKRALVLHEKAHQGRTFQCTECPKSYKYQSSLQQHGHREHTKTGAVASYKCNFCDKKFTTKHYLKEHGNVHTGERHQCPHCESKFTFKTNLAHHMKQNHKPGGPSASYECNFCDKKFTTKHSLKEHGNVHTANKWQCPHCKSKFTFKGGLAQHMKQKHCGVFQKKPLSLLVI